MEKLSASRDPVGEVFEKDGQIFRGIHKEYQSYYRDLLNSDTIQQLLGKKVINTRIAMEGLAGYNFVLEHKRISPASFVYEWTFSMLRDAALLTLEICLDLVDKQWVLKDATPFNILFENHNPVWIDFTSIMPQEEDLYWIAYDQFCRTFLFPLIAGSCLKGRDIRSLFLANQNGISPQEVKQYLPALAWIKRPWLLKRLYLPLAMIEMARQSGKEDELSKVKPNIQGGSEPRRRFFEDVKKDLLSIKLPDISSAWSSYYDDINVFFTPSSYNAKQKAIAEFIERCKPANVVDIGCNQGGYSVIASLAGSKVVAFDNDEDSISLFYRLAIEKKLNILPLIGDVVYPSPACGWRGKEFASMQERLKSEMALALALVHHLAITQNQTFDRIVLMLSEYTSRWLVTEFVPITDPRVLEITRTTRRDLSWYTQDNFVDSLRKGFRSVDLVPSHPEGRTLCFCEK
jgi:hypothetical protein